MRSPEAIASTLTGPQRFAFEANTRRNQLLSHAFLALAGFVLGWLGQHASFRLAILPNFAPIWIPGGIFLGLILLIERHHWPALISGTVAGGMTTLIQYKTPPLYAFFFYGLSVLLIVGGRVYLGTKADPIFRDIQTFIRYVLSIVMVLSMVIATIAAFVAYRSGFRADMLHPWLSSAPSAAMGFLILSPLVFTVGSRRLPRLVWNWPVTLEAVLLSLGLIILSAGSWILVPLSPSALLYVTLLAPVPLLLLLALRFGVFGSTLALVLVLIPSAWFSTYGHGVLSRSESNQLNIHIMQLWMLGVGSLIHVLAIQSEQQQVVAEEMRLARNRIRDLASRLLETQESERSRISRELHDGVNQQIAFVGIQMSSLRMLDRDSLPLRIDELLQLVNNLVEDVRRISHNLHPVMLQDSGLVAALKSLVAETSAYWNGHILLDCDQRAEPEYEAALCIYRVAQEGMANATKHADAQNIQMRFAQEKDSWLLEILDDGRGFDIAAVRRSGGLGLLSIEERAQLLGGQAAILSEPGKGARLWMRIPFCG